MPPATAGNKRILEGENSTLGVGQSQITPKRRRPATCSPARAQAAAAAAAAAAAPTTLAHPVSAPASPVPMSPSITDPLCSRHFNTRDKAPLIPGYVRKAPKRTVGAVADADEATDEACPFKRGRAADQVAGSSQPVAASATSPAGSISSNGSMGTGEGLERMERPAVARRILLEEADAVLWRRRRPLTERQDNDSNLPLLFPLSQPSEDDEAPRQDRGVPVPALAAARGGTAAAAAVSMELDDAIELMRGLTASDSRAPGGCAGEPLASSAAPSTPTRREQAPRAEQLHAITG